MYRVIRSDAPSGESYGVDASIVHSFVKVGTKMAAKSA
jgi:hypothetical protein